MCSSRKNPYPPHGRSLEIPRGRGIFKAKCLEAMYENKLEFPGVTGAAKQKNLPWGVACSKHSDSCKRGKLGNVSEKTRGDWGVLLPTI